MRLVLFFILGLVPLAAYLVFEGLLDIPSRYNPWAPLHIDDALGVMTRYKLAKLKQAPTQCYAFLSETPLVFKRQADNSNRPGCALENIVQARTATTSFAATCAVTASWVLFEQHVLQPSAREYFGQEIKRVVHLGTYACRNIGNQPGGRRSEHANANAIDIAAFILEDGTRISLQKDWSSNTAKSGFLHSIHKGACRIFNVSLSPDYNPAHHDHLHLDMGNLSACR